MKICVIICEYNPFHNGHKYLLEEAKKRSNADFVLCLMSGNFVQRGEAAILEKHVRAKHAILCGADAVIELPTVFATSNAEIFARGAVSVLTKIPNVTHLAFGAELADKEAFLQAANALLVEPKCVSETLKELTASGMGYAKAIATARSSIAEKRLFESPNNILGIEYTKALCSENANVEILPIERVGCGHTETTINGTFASASAVRAALRENRQESLPDCLPECVFHDLKNATEANLDICEKIAILKVTPQEIADTLDCTEGLENALIRATLNTERLEKTLSSPRYTAARIRRIALQNLLGIRENLIRKCLSDNLYLFPLAYKKDSADLLSVLSKASIPFLSSGKAKAELSGAAAEAYAIDELAERVYAVLQKTENVNSPIIL